MLPTLEPGDQVLVLRWFPAHRGQVVVARLGNRFMIKRLLKIEDGQVELAGDNPEADQRLYLVPRREIVGVVIFVRRKGEGE